MVINYSRARSRVQELLRGQIEPPVNVEEIARALGASIQPFDMEDDVAGVLYRQGDHRVIAINSRHSPTRQRFTIAHELGHLALHRGQEVHVDQTFRINLRDPLSAQGQDVEEIEANAFAANLLMPLTWLRRDFRGDTIDLEDDAEIVALAERYQVSLQAMLIRLTTLFGSPERSGRKSSE